eukprot:5731360-Amphidinium_carterae.1
MQLDTSGAMQWQRQWDADPPASFTIAVGVAVSSTGLIYVAGYTYWSSEGETHAFLAQFTSSGVREWTEWTDAVFLMGEEFATVVEEFAPGVASIDGSVYVTFYTSRASFDISYLVKYLPYFDTTASNIDSDTTPSSSSEMASDMEFILMISSAIFTFLLALVSCCCCAWSAR